MPSPFPGMDPYLEPQWPDVHLALIAEGRRAINRQLPVGLQARSESRIVIEPDDEPGTRAGSFVETRPDLRIVATTTQAERSADPGGDTTLVLDAPFALLPAADPPIERYLRITDAAGHLLSVVELLSPSNKRGEGLDRFRRNRLELLAAGVHFVEVDLVRAGDWRALMWPARCPPRAASPWRAVVRTAGPGGNAYLFPIRLREALPDIPVPIRPGVPPATLPLAAMLAAAYDDGKYSESVDYTRPPDPPLDADDAAWAAELLAGRPSGR